MKRKKHEYCLILKMYNSVSNSLFQNEFCIRVSEHFLILNTKFKLLQTLFFLAKT